MNTMREGEPVFFQSWLEERLEVHSYARYNLAPADQKREKTLVLYCIAFNKLAFR